MIKRKKLTKPRIINKKMRVEESAGTIHGHPITEKEYKKLLK